MDVSFIDPSAPSQIRSSNFFNYNLALTEISKIIERPGLKQPLQEFDFSITVDLVKQPKTVPKM